MKKKAKRIEIIGASREALWYVLLAGQGCQFDVVQEYDDTYRVNVGGVKDDFHVYKCDCVAVEWTEQTYRRFNNQEMNDLVGKVIVDKSTPDHNKVLVTACATRRDGNTLYNVVYLGDHTVKDSGVLLNFYSFPNGLPCGVET